MRRKKVIIYGLGEIGKEAARLVLSKKGLNIVGAYDIDPNKIGKDLGEIIGVDKTGIRVKNSDYIYADNTKADVALHMTQSGCQQVYSQLMALMDKGYNIVSSCEELSYPWLSYPDITSALEKRAKEKKVTVFGTGVNPGFLMDRLVLVMTGMCKNIEEIHAERIVNAGKRRLPLQKKVGAGMEVEDFRKIKDKIGHKGFPESLAIIEAGLGWKFDKINHTLDCMIAEEDLATDYLSIKKGQVTGINQYIAGLKNGKEVVTLHLMMYVGNHQTYDSIKIVGEPPVSMKIENGLHGDRATVASLVNSIPAVIKAKPGILTVDQLSYPIFFE